MAARGGSHSEVGEATRRSHAGLILFRQTLGTSLAGPPYKLLNYMNAGLPVLSIGFAELPRMVREEECRVLVEDQSVDVFVRGIDPMTSPEALGAMGEAGQGAIRERYSWQGMERILLAAYEELERRLRPEH